MSFISTLSPKNKKNILLPIDKKYQNIPVNTSLFLFGKSGNGKTTLALQIAKQTENNTPEIDVIFIKFNDLVAVARKTFSDDFYTKRDSKEYLEQVKNCNLLILDDVGTEKNTEFVDQFIYEIIDYRYEYELSTIITSNFSLLEISQRYHERIASRILAMCKVVKLADFDIRTTLTDSDKKFEFVIKEKKADESDPYPLIDLSKYS